VHRRLRHWPGVALLTAGIVLLVMSVVWLGLRVWVPANWWNLLLCSLFGLAGAALLFEARRPA